MLAGPRRTDGLHCKGWVLCSRRRRKPAGGRLSGACAERPRGRGRVNDDGERAGAGPGAAAPWVTVLETAYPVSSCHRRCCLLIAAQGWLVSAHRHFISMRPPCRSLSAPRGNELAATRTKHPDKGVCPICLRSGLHQKIPCKENERDCFKRLRTGQRNVHFP